MTVPKWLIPVLAIVAAIAVGVTGWLVAVQLRPGPEAPPAPVIETLPVAGPVDADAEGDGGGEGDGDDPAISPALGFEDVVVPSDDGSDGPDPRLAGLIEDLGSADDPGAGPAEIYDGSDAPPGAAGEPGSGDPCAPIDGEPAADCPDGIHGTILALTAPEEPFYAVASASPPRYEDLPGPTRLVYCDPVELDDTSLLIGIGTNAPADLTFTYWPDGDPDAAISRALSTPAEVSDAWYAGLDADGDFSEDWARPQHCFPLDDLDPAATYQARIQATDELGRTAASSLRFMLDRDLSAPPVRVIPLTDNVLFVSAPHIEAQTATLRVAAVPEGDADAACDAGEPLPEFNAPFEHRVSDEYNRAHGYLPSYTHRTSGAWSVPEGSVVAVCIRWFDESAPSWGSDTPVREFTQFLMSPDRLSPVVELVDLGLRNAMEPGSVAVLAATREGYHCGAWNGPSVLGTDAALGDGVVLCDLADAALWTRASAGGDIVVRTRVFDGGETIGSSGTVLRLAAAACRGVCEIPEPSEYRVLLPTVPDASGLCGSSFGDECDPPTTERAAGTAVIRVSWTQGPTNGAAEWVLGAGVTLEPGDPPLSDFPRMDTLELPETWEHDGQRLAGFTLRVDRPVDYEVTLHGDCEIPVEFGGPPTISTHGGSLGADARERRIVFGQVCHDTDYWVEVTLTDASGSWTYGPETPGPQFWHSIFRTPSLEAIVSATIVLPPVSELFPRDVAVAQVTRAVITIDGRPISAGLAPACLGSAGLTLRGAPTTIELSERPEVEVWLQMYETDGSDGTAGARCEWPGPGAVENEARFTVFPSYDELVSGRTLSLLPDFVSVDVSLLGSHP